MTDERHIDCDEIEVKSPAGFRGRVIPVTCRVPFQLACWGANFTAPFFVADRDYEVLYAEERHEGSSAVAVTCTVNRVPNGIAPAAGAAVLIGAFALDAAVNTIQRLEANPAAAHLSAGDSLSVTASHVFEANTIGVTVTVYLRAV